MKVLITDGLSKAAIADLKAKNYQVTEQFFEDEKLGDALKDFNAVVVRSATKIRKKHLDKALETGNLKLIIRGGVGIDNIDHEYAESRGISVKNTPAASSPSVAELAVAHMFSLARALPFAKMSMSEGKWEKKKFNGIELAGKTVGVVGMGRIGIELATRAKALGMEVIFYDVREDLEVSSQFRKVTLDELYKDSDFISLHIPAQDNGKPVVGSDEIKKMKDGVYIINCARGGVIDENALIEALDSGKVTGAGIDVYEEEPTKNIRLASHQNVSATPHIGAQTKEAQARVGAEVVQVISKFFEK
ncbi:MAG: D-2-hydroxyacid dehydrogenase [Oligoflexia bacterium]|nr:D-2-hydroxyacid dehydrogenase [Oligoflexia bacterium]